MSEVYISVDIEASGPVPPTYSMLSIGACIVGAPERSFYAELCPISEGAVPAALEVVGRPLDYFQRNGREPHDAMLEFEQWIREMSGDGEAVFVGFNATFDWAFVNWYFVTFLGENPFGIGGVDIKSYYMGMANVSWAETRSSRLPPTLKGSEPETHDALDDARRQAALFARMRSAQ
jgi:DNA polymerase III epsilon subunit-like protein